MKMRKCCTSTCPNILGVQERCCGVAARCALSHTNGSSSLQVADNRTCNKVNIMTRTERVTVHKLLLSLQRNETHVDEVTLQEGAEHHLAHRKPSSM